MRFETMAIHAGQEPDPSTGAITIPIYLTSTYKQEAPGKHKGYEYSRTANPTRTALEKNLASLESGRFGLALASGLAATNTVMNLLKSGDHVVAGNDLYGGTYRLFTKLYTHYGLKFDFVDASDPSQVEAAIKSDTRMIWIESPTNPLLRLCDISEIVKIAKRKEIVVAVDNTFATPYLQRPIELGADIVIHSTTKYLGGHSDIVGGAIILSREDLKEQLFFFQNAVGAVPSPLDCWLVLRGTKTLPVRMDRHCQNAQRIAEFLEKHKKIKKVNYPGLKSHPQYELAKKQMSAPGGMISFELKDGGLQQAIKVVSNTKIFSLAESLGGVESLIEHPTSMTHSSIPFEERKRSGLSDDLIRLSVGIENIDDLIEDLERALGS